MLLRYLAKHGNSKIASVHSNAVLPVCQTSASLCLISLINLVDSQFILMLLYDSINLVINGDQLWAVGWATAQDKVE